MKNTRKIEIPMLGTFNETVLPTQINTEPAKTIDLFSVKEDKYSVFREIDMEMQDKTPIENVTDDFGDFLSADAPKSPTPSEEKADNWGDWSFNSEPVSKPEPVTITENLFDMAEAQAGPKIENTFDPGFSLNSDLLNFNLSGSDFSKDSIREPKKILEETNDKVEWITSETKSIHLDETDNEFKDFLTAELKPPVLDNLSRHSSLPSLEFKISPSEETELESIWRKCLETCLNILQEGWEIFNSVTTKSVLEEVFSTQEATDYLNSKSF